MSNLEAWAIGAGVGVMLVGLAILIDWLTEWFPGWWKAVWRWVSPRGRRP